MLFRNIILDYQSIEAKGRKMNSYYIGITLFSIMVMVIMIAIVSGNRCMANESKRRLIFTFVGIMLAVTVEFIGVLLDGKSEETVILHYIVKVVEFSVAPFISVTCANAFFSVSEVEKKFMNVILCMHVALEVGLAFLGKIFYIDESYIYHHGSLYWVYVVIYVLSIIFYFQKAYMFSQKYQNRNAYILILILGFMVSSIVIQSIISNLRLDWMTIAVSAIFMFIYYNEITQHIDGLTQLLNQRSFFCDTTNLTTAATILVFDVDDFKSINDNYGHQYGNEYLKQVAEMIQRVYGQCGLCYRIGGDEFAVVLNSSAKIDKLNAVFVAEQNNAQIQSGRKRFPTISVGHEIFNPEYDDIRDVIQRADYNMYQTKLRKKGRI